MAEKQGVINYYKYKSLLATLPPEDQGRILMASLEYNETGTRIHLENPAAEMLFSAMLLDFDALRARQNREKKDNNAG
jgi:hypothetical protein